ncbi:type IV toxin-antitoxin system AbiEi family antitoxin [Algoriphagus sp.]|uniref:type IV toxin-antitoxin system AbiEi family antitoxin n=1 Tax=Algoriphagus sp. TaxID=1872435 RepID=UPI0039199216
MRAREFIKQLQSNESYSFSLDEMRDRIKSSKVSLKFELVRLTEKKEIVNLRRGFYLIIPPRYSKQAQLPIQLFIDKLCGSLNRNYYLGFYTAAKFHGASHQQAQREYVMVEKPKLDDITKGEYDIRFFTSSTWPSKNIIEKKSEAGLFKISSPALTAADLIHHQTKLGGINRMLAIIEELSEEITDSDLKDLLTWYPHKSTLQRLGFLLEKIQVNIDLGILYEYLISGYYFPTLLSPKANQNPSAVNNKWKVDVNIKLETDL